MMDDCACLLDDCENPNDCRALVSRALQSDESARHAIHQRFQNQIMRIVRYRLGGDRSADWDDVSQEILLRVFVKLPSWRREGRFCDWLRVVAKRHAINLSIQLSARRHEVELGDIEPRDKTPVDPATRECLEVVVATFPEVWRQALRLRSQGKLVSEVAGELNVSEKTVKNWTAAMYERLCECLRS